MSDSAQLYQRLRASFARSKQSSSSAAQLQSAASLPIPTSTKLDVLAQVLTQVEQSAQLTASQAETKTFTSPASSGQNSPPSAGVLAQALPQVTLQTTDSLNPTVATTIIKEAESNLTPEIGPVEAGAGLAQVELEPAGELPVEVESFLQHAETQQEQLPPEIVIADGSSQISSAHQPAKQPVIVLPITPREEKEGRKKSLHWSIRWLVEWSQKIMKMFSGKVIYRQEPVTT